MQLRSAAPIFQVADVAATMRWYQARLGFTPHPFPAAPPHVFCVLERDGVEIMLQRVEGLERVDTYRQRAGGVWHVYLRVAGVHAFDAALRRAGDVEILEPLHRQPYGDTELVVRDPDGHVVVISELLD
jgi:catechol 2,3-dioxygenase-like lactoylglutathione lyase family enzyme